MPGPLAEHKRIVSEILHLNPQEARVEQRSREWFQLRRGRITASNFAAAAGLNPFRSRNKVYQELTGRSEPPDLSHVPAVKWGTKWEDAAIRAYEAVMGDFGVQHTGLVLDGYDPFLAASPDGFAGEPDDHGRGQIYLEAKCPYGRDGSGIRLYDEIPEYYMPQIQGGLSVTRRTTAHFFCYVPGATGENRETGEENAILRREQIAIWEVEASEEYAAVLRSLLREFYAEYVCKHRQPPKLGKRPSMPPVKARQIFRGAVEG